MIHVIAFLIILAVMVALVVWMTIPAKPKPRRAKRRGEAASKGRTKGAAQK